VKWREQLFNLLANKFRDKYISSVVSDESNVDRIIRTEITRFLEREHMTEGNLVKHDQRLGELLENWGNKPSSGLYGRTPLDSCGGQDTLIKSVDYNNSRGPSGLTKGPPAPLSQNGNGSERSRSSAIKQVGN
jgi:hypothetical protein